MNQLNTRALAYSALVQIEKGSTIQEALSELRIGDERERKFVTTLVKGTVRNKLKLNWIINKYSKIRIKKMDRATYLFLLIGFYQLIEMDSVPDYAAVDETLNAMKKLKLKRSTGFVNGILRAFIRDEKNIQLPDNKNIQRLSVVYSFPEWLIERFSKHYDDNTLRKIIETFLNEPALSVFINKRDRETPRILDSLKSEGIEFAENEYFDDMITVNGSRISETSAFKDGYLYIQDNASRLVSFVTGALDGSTVLDAAASPGGKTINLLADGKDVTSVDISEHKTSTLRSNLQRLRLNADKIHIADSTKPLPFDTKFDIVLLDSPCSATGRIRKAPEIKYRLSENDFSALNELQLKLLQNLQNYVIDGGYLVYSTCSLDRHENEDVINEFLQNNPGWKLNDPTPFLPEKFPRAAVKDNFIKTISLIEEMDGFFIAVLSRS